MKIYTIVILCFCFSPSFSQGIDSLFSKRQIRSDLVVTINKDTGRLGKFPVSRNSVVTFKSGSASVYYYVFNYQQSDSTKFRKAEEGYWIVSGCNTVRHKESRKNFRSFIYGGYYFLLQRCACQTALNKPCAKLAKRINQWRKDDQ